MIDATSVILCSGSCTRLWPLSRTGFPKQFLWFIGDESLFQQAARRLVGMGNEQIKKAHRLIFSGGEYLCFLASEQLREAGIALGAAFLEPISRNTAPALTLAALAATQNGQDSVLLATPADQTVVNNAAFATAVQRATKVALNSTIVILGVKPTQPERNDGYIQAAAQPGIAGSSPYRKSVHLYSLGRGIPLANPGNIPLEIIEVRSGSYLSEDDIVRFEDGYGRATA